VWGLVRCDRCARLFQRDINSALNILTVVWAALRGQGRPSYLTAEAAPPATQHGGDSSSSDGVGVSVRGAML
jgi:transposase